jgi:hypothetical protein
MENKVILQDNQLIVEPIGIDKVWSFTSKLFVPVSNVMGATVDKGILDANKGLRDAGLGLPNKWSGVFNKDGEKTFWNANRTDAPIVIQLKNEKFARLVLTVDNPNKLANDINNLVE